MQDTLNRYLVQLSSEMNAAALRPALTALVDRFSSQATSSAGLVITGAGGTTAKIGTTPFAGTANGVPVAIAAGTSMPALVGTIDAGKYNVFCFFIDSASNVTVEMGTEGATLAGVTFPPFPQKKALVGYLVVTYASAFTGGTTALDTATTVYVSPVGAFDPTLLIG
jgi:hypothetical protein